MSRATGEKPGEGRTALVTGASVGIGYWLARLLAADGYSLALVARDGARLEAVAEELRPLGAAGVRVIPTDLAKAPACEQIIAALGQTPVDILINNAGFGVGGAFAAADAGKQLDLLQVNIVSLTHLVRLVLPGMLERGRGRVMNVASVAAFVAGPYMATYYASKAYVLSFSLALAEECRGSGVSVTAVCPGPTRTEFFSRAGIADAGISSGHMMTAEAVAKIGYRGMLAGTSLVVTGAMNRLLAQATRVAPKMLAARVAGKRNRMRNG